MAAVSDYLHRKASRNKIPLDGVFELSPVCNFSCKMCYVRKTPEQLRLERKELISWEQWLDMAKQCYEAGTLFLLLTGGEPFLYPDFKKLYIHLHKMGFVLAINTNGTLIDEETVEWLKQYAPSRINITLYGNSPETYEKICGNAAGYVKAVKAINMLHAAGIPVVINASMIPENVHDLESIIDFGHEKDLYVRMSTYMFPPARREHDERDSRFTPEEAAAIYLRKYRKLYDKEEYNKFIHNMLKKGREQMQTDTWGSNYEYMWCRAGRSSFWISWEGKMTACGMLDFPLQTNPFEESFRECWLRITEAVRNTEVLHGCRDCEKREFCRPCVAMIYTETGTVDQKAPYLCRMSQCILEQMSEEKREYIDEERK